MAKMIHFNRGNASDHQPLCLACEELLPDFLDGALTPADQAFFDHHLRTCSTCSATLADAQRGAAWLELLKDPRPEPSATLLDRILAQTAALPAEDEIVLPQASPSYGDPWAATAPQPARVLDFPAWFRPAPAFSPRLAMTAAMAFFSIALTLNLSGVRLDQFHASALTPTHVRQSYYQASAEAIRYCDNLRFVQAVESGVSSLRDGSGSDGKPADEKNPTLNSPDGQSRREAPDTSKGGLA